MLVHGKPYRTVWMEGREVKMIDQRQLPHVFTIASCASCRDTAQAIKDMVVRGAGAIGVAAGYAMTQAALEAPDATFHRSVAEAAEAVRASRPTAHDLFYAVDRLLEAITGASDPTRARQEAVRLARQLSDDNASAGEAIGRAGARLLRSGMRVLTHCNAGWLAFADWGSALAPVYYAHRQGVALFVYVDETRPRSQGAKLTAWELSQEGVPYTIVADTAAGSLFQHRDIDGVLVGADRIAANGDVANKIGTYPLALLAKHHEVPFYVAAPRSTFDLAAADGRAITIEERGEDEVLWVSGVTPEGTAARVRVAPEGASARNPAFDVTPAGFVTRFITEAGLVEPAPGAIAAFVRHQPTSAGR